MSLLHKIYSGYTSVERYFNIFAMILIVAMMLMVTGDVAGRYLFHRPLPAVLELTEFFMAGIVYAALAYTQFIKGHISIELLVDRYSPRKRLIMETISLFIGLIFFALVVWQGGRMAWAAWQIREITFTAAMPMPVYPAKFMVPIGSLLMCIRFIAQIAENMGVLLRGGLRT